MHFCDKLVNVLCQSLVYTDAFPPIFMEGIRQCLISQGVLKLCGTWESGNENNWLKEKEEKERERCHIGKKAMWRWRRRLGPCCHKPRSSRSIQTWEEARMDTTPEHLEEARSCATHWFWALCLQNYERIHFLHFRKHSLWSFVTQSSGANMLTNSIPKCSCK